MYTLTAGYIFSHLRLDYLSIDCTPRYIHTPTHYATHYTVILHTHTTHTTMPHHIHTQHTLHYTPHTAHYSTHCTTHTTVHYTPHPHPSHLSSVGVCACQTRLCPVVQCCCPSLLPAGHLCSRIPTHTHIIYIHTCMHNSCVYACSSTWTHTHILHGMCEHTL
jgi:hypothetical protein